MKHLILLIPFSNTLFAQALLQTPIERTQGEEWIKVNNVDWDTTAGFQDHNCGTKSYDEHQGTDFTIPSIKQLDAGVKVYAAASGRGLLPYSTSIADQHGLYTLKREIN